MLRQQWPRLHKAALFRKVDVQATGLNVCHADKLAFSNCVYNIRFLHFGTQLVKTNDANLKLSFDERKQLDWVGKATNFVRPARYKQVRRNLSNR